MRGLVVGAAALMGLAGCMHSQEIAASRDGDAACKARGFKTMVELTQCRNAAFRLAAPAYAGKSDLVELGLAQRMVLAEKVDRGEITMAQYELEMAKTRVALENADRNRSVQQRLAQACTQDCCA